MNLHVAPTESGLTAYEAHARLLADGPNEIATEKPRGPWAIAIEVVREPMFLLLIACAALYFLMGDPRDALMLLGFVVVVMGITFIQQRRTERALEALRDLSSPRALVVRDGIPARIAGRDVVRDDLLIVAEGDRVPADSVLLSGLNISVDESLLTGESVPVRKAPSSDVPSAMGAPGGDDAPYLFSGTLLVQGKGKAIVLRTGSRTALGCIGAALTEIEEEPTHVQRETAVVVKRLATGGVALSLLIAVIYAATRGDWLNGLLAGITTAMAILPEELPVILTIFLGIGAWRIARKHVLTRRIPAIETLGSATVLCTDKTGTLTQNRMEVVELAVSGATLNLKTHPDIALPENFHPLLEFAALAGHRDPFDPMERAIATAATTRLAQTEHLHADWELVNEYPLSHELQAMSRVWTSKQERRYVIATKGAPEAIADLCHLKSAAVQAVKEAADAIAARGLRVLGVARAYFTGATLPEIQHGFNFEFLGLVGLADPLRPDVPAAIREAHAAGIRVVMITGDYAVTAMSIAAQAGIDTRAGYLTGTQLSEMDEIHLGERVHEVNVYCRVVPEQKLRLVNALKAAGETVAMTGDGVNDAPALKAAHIGIAMGERGTDVAREAAALVLLDDDFTSIVEAVRQGRRIFDNLRNAVTFVVAVHVPIVGMSFLPVALGWPLLLMPVHVMFLQLVIDPVCSVVFEGEPEDEGTMRNRPRMRSESLFGAQSVLVGLLQGLTLLAGVIAVHLLARIHGLEPDSARAVTFATVVLGALVLVFTNRSRRGLVDTFRRRNYTLWGITGMALLLLGLVLSLPMLRAPFHFGAVRMDDVIGSVVAVSLCGLLFEVLKRVLSKPVLLANVRR